MSRLYEIGAAPTPNPVKGIEIMEAMLLEDYENSENLKEFLRAFMDELNTLFLETERVYLGRFLTDAVGAQLDAIGVILDEDRAIDLPQKFFGLKDSDQPIPITIGPFADESTPSDGGVFRSDGQLTGSTHPLSDQEFRRVLLAKAFIMSKDVCSTNNAYEVMSLLMNRVPRTLKITTSQTVGSSINKGRVVEVLLSREDTTDFDAGLISYFSRYIVPMGTSFTVTRI